MTAERVYRTGKIIFATTSQTGDLYLGYIKNFKY